MEKWEIPWLISQVNTTTMPKWVEILSTHPRGREPFFSLLLKLLTVPLGRTRDWILSSAIIRIEETICIGLGGGGILKLKTDQTIAILSSSPHTSVSKGEKEETTVGGELPGELNVGIPFLSNRLRKALEIGRWGKWARRWASTETPPNDTVCCGTWQGNLRMT